VGITRPVVKHNFLVKDVRDLALTMKKAFHIARTGRPGPVVVDIPKDVSLKTAPFHYPETVEMRSYNPVRRATAARSARPCSCCCRPSGPTSTPAAA
jgi:acetolactate synthase-1/2/3 large subunit